LIIDKFTNDPFLVDFSVTSMEEDVVFNLVYDSVLIEEHLYDPFLVNYLVATKGEDVVLNPVYDSVLLKEFYRIHFWLIFQEHRWEKMLFLIQWTILLLS
jgi:hypothetical protein